MVDEAYQDSSEWIKKSIRTTAKASHSLIVVFQSYIMDFFYYTDGQIQFRQGYSRLCTGILEHREREGRVKLISKSSIGLGTSGNVKK